MKNFYISNFFTFFIKSFNRSPFKKFIRLDKLGLIKQNSYKFLLEKLFNTHNKGKYTKQLWRICVKGNLRKFKLIIYSCRK